MPQTPVRCRITLLNKARAISRESCYLFAFYAFTCILRHAVPGQGRLRGVREACAAAEVPSALGTNKVELN